ncbi:Hpt domain-containing protein [Neotamlana laminarinivorans]|uniref:Hpt domain-containing protein n=1 Tax=Neotamlana laminarinivorans TaxID=2883124 RepID=A0A9X1L515_9FLAO|nr:Hpt domain-containing protein [Tamlana laminarinivorans]MCB4798881.1 Hpt domain-containing protein [Tamlana laminarinivorans]
MEQHYKLYRVRELADNDDDFILALAQTFVEEVAVDAERLKKAVADKNYHEAYQAAHKMKPTIDLFELGVLNTLIEVQDWGKFTKTDQDITEQLNIVITAVDNALAELKSDFNL